MRYVIFIKTSPTTDDPTVRTSYISIYPRPRWNSNADMRTHIAEEIGSTTNVLMKVCFFGNKTYVVPKSVTMELSQI